MKNSDVIKNVYNVTPDQSKSAFLVISQVGEYCIQVSLTLTSTAMRDEPTAQQAESEPVSQSAGGGRFVGLGGGQK